MWQHLKKKILVLKEVAGLEIILLPNDEFLLRLVLLKIKKGNVHKEFEYSHLTQITQLKEKLSINIPIALVINGKGMLQKKIEDKSISNENFDIEKILPNINPNDFFQQFESYEAFKIISLMRNDLIEKIIQKINNEGFKVLSVDLGFKSFAALLPLLKNTKATEIETSNNNLIINNAEIINYKPIDPLTSAEKSKIEYNLGDQYIKAGSLVAFGAAVNLLSGSFEGTHDSHLPTIKSEREEYKNYLFFKAAAWCLLSFLFTSLLVNFLIYNHFFLKNKELSSIQKNSSEQIDKKLNLENEIKLKESFIQTSGWLYNSRISLFADRIGAATTDDILLTSMNIQPLSSGLYFENGDLTFKKDTIQITGFCDDPLQLNIFVNKIKSIREVNKVVVKNYSNKKENESGLFSLELLTK
jgi:hypothetical protein